VVVVVHEASSEVFTMMVLIIVHKVRSLTPEVVAITVVAIVHKTCSLSLEVVAITVAAIVHKKCSAWQDPTVPRIVIVVAMGGIINNWKFFKRINN
jgi:hypothetical protein